MQCEVRKITITVRKKIQARKKFTNDNWARIYCECEYKTHNYTERL